jgi:2-dehydro-3-deoxygluconokinase
MLKSRRTSSIQNVDYYRRESAGSHLHTADVDVALISCADVFHVSAITSALSGDARDAVRSAISTAKRAGTQVSIDLNYRSALWSREEAAPEFRFLAEAADILFCTVSEAQIVTQGDDPVTLARQLAEYGAGHVVVKQGSDGAISWRDGKSSVVKPIRVSAFDEVGAGDAFAAGFLASLIAGGDPDRNLAWAAAMGAWAVSTRGDWEGLPTLDELSDSLRHNQTSDSVVR